jgi:hypothetical protein
MLSSRLVAIAAGFAESIADDKQRQTQDEADDEIPQATHKPTPAAGGFARIIAIHTELHGQRRRALPGRSRTSKPVWRRNARIVFPHERPHMDHIRTPPSRRRMVLTD